MSAVLESDPRMQAAATLALSPAPEGYASAFLEDLVPAGSLMEEVETNRLSATRQLESAQRAKMGQFFTPSAVATFMASMFSPLSGTVRLLDAGAGIGSLTAAFVAQMCAHSKRRAAELSITAYEIEPTLIPFLTATLRRCDEECRQAGIDLRWEVRDEDFLEAGSAMLSGRLFDSRVPSEFDCVILNPPYRKIRSDSKERRLIRSLGLETSNLYTAFLATSSRLLRQGGEMVAITPRSFCNGPYFRPFRQSFLDSMSLRRIHVYRSRSQAFQADKVLQENIIIKASKQKRSRSKVVISSSHGPKDSVTSWFKLDSSELVEPTDPNLFIHVVTSELERRIAQSIDNLDHSLDDLQISVSTGRVVDFRSRDYLRWTTGNTTVPLIYPSHFEDGFVNWPSSSSRKANAILRSPETEDLLVQNAFYVLTKRFSTKEEKRRVVAAIFDPDRIWPNCDERRPVGFENHVNYFHSNGSGLPATLARGLAVYLNSTLVDAYFRQFNGHTQVNATDLRSLPYPSPRQLEALGNQINSNFPNQNRLDQMISRVLKISAGEMEVFNPVSAKKRIEEALIVLKEIELPKAQQNERSALVLLALLDLAAEDNWRKASNPLRGITELMGFMADQYGETYAPNTRETVRKDTVHQFVHAGLAVKNPDEPGRPTNSPKTRYQISPIALKLFQSFGSDSWPEQLQRYLASSLSLRQQYAKERRMERVPLRLPDGTGLALSPGGQSILVKKIVDDFCPLFAAGAELVYIGDTAKKWAFFQETILRELGVEISEHGKMPDVVVFQRDHNWLFLIEAVSSRGPMDAKRQLELRELFLGSTAGLVFVTACQTRAEMSKHLPTIAWETEVWIAETPTHIIHFDGERFLGPYKQPED